MPKAAAPAQPSTTIRPDDELVNLAPDELSPIEAILAAGLRDVALPSGLRLKVREIGWTDALVEGVVPIELAGIVSAAATKGRAKWTPEDVAAAGRASRLRAAASVTHVHDGARFVPWHLDEATFARLSSADRAALVDALKAEAAPAEEVDGG